MDRLHWPEPDHDAPPWAPALRPVVPALGQAYPHLAPLGDLTVPEERYRLADAIARALHDFGERQPLLIVIDDLQWSDTETLRVLQHLGAMPRSARFAVMVAFRDQPEQPQLLVDALAELRRTNRFEDIAIPGFGMGEVALLMREITGADVPDAIAHLVWEAAHGNPFYVQELTRHFYDEGLLTASATRDDTGPDRELSIPDSLRQVVEHRLNRLSAPTQQMLRLAAVCTDGFDFPVLRGLTSLDENGLLDAIDEAIAARLIRPVGEGERYEFQHSLVRRALYDSWSPSRRARLHRSLARSLEQAHADAPHLHAPAVATHYHISASVPGAEAGVPYALAAARHAQQRFAPEQAVTYFRIARDLAIGLPPTERASINAELTLAEANALWLDAALDSARDTMLLLEEAGASNGDKARFIASTVTALHDGGQSSELWMPLLYRGLALVPDDDELTWARLTLLIERFEPVRSGPVSGARWLGSDPRATWIARSSGDEELFARSLQPWDLWNREWTEHLSNQVATWQTPSAIIRALTVCGADWLYHHGEFRQAQAHFENLLAIAERHGSIPGQAEACVRLSIIHSALGNVPEARSFHQRATAMVKRLGRGHRLHASLWWARTFLRQLDGGPWDDIAAYFTAYIADPAIVRRTIGFDDAALAAFALAQSGEEARARVLIEALVDVLDHLEPTLWLLNGTVSLAAAAVWTLQAADLAPTLRVHTERVIAAGHDDFPCCSNHLAIARLATLQGLSDDARLAFARARTHLDRSGQRPTRAMVDLDEASVLARGSFADRDAAIALAEQAGAQFGELGLPAWKQRASFLATKLTARQQEPGEAPAGLTQRELDVVRRIARGYSDRQIGDEIFVSPRTVNAHVRNILAKTNLKNRTELSIWAIEQGLVRPDRTN